MNTEKVKEALTKLQAERSSLMYTMSAYDAATNDENRQLAIKAILNNLTAIDTIGDEFRAAVFESRTLDEVMA